MANRWGNNDWLYFLGLQNHCRWWLQHEIKRCLFLGRKAKTNLDSVLKNRGITLLTKLHVVKCMVFPVVMYGCECWTIKKAECQRIYAFELRCWRRLFRVPLDSKEFISVHPKGNQSWKFIGRTDAETETPILWPPDAKKWFIGKDPDAEKDWIQEEKGMTEERCWFLVWPSSLWLADGISHSRGLFSVSVCRRRETSGVSPFSYKDSSSVGLRPHLHDLI